MGDVGASRDDWFFPGVYLPSRTHGAQCGVCAPEPRPSDAIDTLSLPNHLCRIVGDWSATVFVLECFDDRAQGRPMVGTFPGIDS